MTAKIEEMSKEDLQRKIENLKAERERMAETLTTCRKSAQTESTS